MPRHQGAGMVDAILLNFDRNRRIYITLFLVYVFGISAGSFWINGMGAEQQSVVVSWFNGFISNFANTKVNWTDILFLSLYRHVLLALIIWFFGTSVAGIPFNYVTMGIKGFITGLASGFFIKIKGIWGLGYSILAILPVELAAIPVVIAMTALSINFSSFVREGRGQLKALLGKYTLDFGVYMLFLCSLSFFDALVIPRIIETILGV